MLFNFVKNRYPIIILKYVFLGEQVFRIEIADKNDHPPRFTQPVYIALAIPEDANINSLVTEVKALDNDTGNIAYHLGYNEGTT